MYGKSVQDSYQLLLRKYLLVSSADNFCKRLGSRSGLTKHRTRAGSKLFDTCKKISKTTMKENQQTMKKHVNYPVGKELSDLAIFIKFKIYRT